MRPRTVVTKRMVEILRTALDAADLEYVPVYAIATPDDIWAIPARPAVAAGVYSKRSVGNIVLGGGNVEQSCVLRVGVAYLVDDPTSPTSAITEASMSLEALREVCEPAIRGEDLSDGYEVAGPIRSASIEEETSRSPFAHDQRGGGLLALLQTFDTTEFYE